MRTTWIIIATLGTASFLGCSRHGTSVPLSDQAGTQDTGGSDNSNDGSGGSSASNGSGSGGNSGGANAGSTPIQNVNFIPLFPGSGKSDAGQPLVGGMVCDEVPGATVHAVTETTRCFFGPDSMTDVAATIEQVLECVDGVDSVHLRLTFDPQFVDNTYGAGSIGWPAKRGHRFSDLVKSDHAELVLIDGNGDVAIQFKMDYISEDPNAPSGYGTLGVSGGDGSVSVGDPAYVLDVHTSLDENLNSRGYDSYVVDSPATDDNFSPNPATPEWDYRMVYYVRIDVAAFGNAGFSGAFIDYVHASPSKKPEDTVDVIPGKCPPCQDTPNAQCGSTPPPPPTTDGGCSDLPDEQCDSTPPPPPPADGGCGDVPDEQCGPGGPLDPPPPQEPPYCERYPSDPSCLLL